jgi:protein arginine N-methyltransferase 2
MADAPLGSLEMLIHAMKGASSNTETITLRSDEKGAAGDNFEFLKSQLTWETGDDGRERVVDADGNG